MTISSNNSNTVITKNTCNLSSVPSEGCYKLSIVRQHSLEVDSFVENGQQKNVHYVIKNSAFVLEVALRKMDKSSPLSPSSNTTSSPIKLESGDNNSSLSLDFNKVTIEAELLYDCEGDKSVFKVRSRPLSTKGIVNPTSPCLCKLETIVEVLSSQHEDMNFKIKLTVVDSTTRKKLDFIAPVYSAPFQVISKPEVLIKKRQRSKKGTRNKTKQDQILEALARIEKKQSSQQSQIDYLLGIRSNDNDSSSSFQTVCTPPVVGQKRPFFDNQTTSSVPSLETSYFQFLAAYDRVKRSERPAKLRKLFSNSTPTDLTNFMEASQYLQSQQYHLQTQTITPQEPQPVLFSAEDINLGPSLEQLLADLS